MRRGENLREASSGLRTPAKLLMKGMSRAAKAHLADWAEDHVRLGLERSYNHAVAHMHNKSEVPTFLSKTVISIFDRVWTEVAAQSGDGHQ